MPEMPSIHGSQCHAAEEPVHIVGFAKTVDVFSSKQKPKKLAIYGSDFRYKHVPWQLHWNVAGKQLDLGVNAYLMSLGLWQSASGCQLHS